MSEMAILSDMYSATRTQNCLKIIHVWIPKPLQHLFAQPLIHKYVYLHSHRKKLRSSSGRERSPSVSEGDDGQGGHIGHIPGPPPQPGPVPPGGAVRIREARVAKPHASPVLSERHLMSVYRDERTIKEQGRTIRFDF